MAQHLIVVVSQPRSGTTLLQHLLGSHSQIHTVPEPWLLLPVCDVLTDRLGKTSYNKKHSTLAIDEFCEQTEGARQVILAGLRELVLSAYNKALAGTTKQWFLDKTTRYFHVIAELGQVIPEARFIVLTRNPIDLVQSYHRRLLYTLDEDVRDFSTAWHLQSERAAGKSLPRKCRDPLLLRYEDVGKIGLRIESILRLVPRDQCLIILFDEFIESPLAVYKKALAIIGLDYDGRTEFPVHPAQISLGAVHNR